MYHSSRLWFVALGLTLSLLPFKAAGAQQKQPPPQQQGLIQALDRDNDDRVSSGEFPGAVEQFRTLDIDNDGWVTEDDFSLVRGMRRREWIPVLASPAAIIFSIFVSVWLLRHQLRSNAFLEFTKRYAEVHSKLPLDLWTPGEAPVALTARQRAALWEFFFLYWIEWTERRRLLRRKTWKTWRRDLAKFLQNSTARQFWQAVRDRYEPAFQTFVDRLAAPARR